ncbi:MAG: TatD family hydrolase, partial [Firmicutes bacterium]|nr:TatD family hydrolase [Bacillota bacterium]
MLFDSHTHLNNEDMSESYLQQLYKEIESSDVKYVCDIGFDLGSSLKAVEHAKALPWCYAVVGVHPHDAKTLDEDVLLMIKSLAKKDKVQAIGEIGLD